MDGKRVDSQLRTQDGVIARFQVIAASGDDNDIERLLRRKDWARVHDGVYVDHTGPPTWKQRAWAAVLVHWPAALAGRSALRAHGLRVDEPAVIEVVVAGHRTPSDPAGVHSVRARAFDDLVRLGLSPPRVRLEPAVLMAAAAARSDDAAVALVADAVQEGRTTTERLATALGAMPRLPRRRLLREVLGDVGAGALSAMERRYLRDVERAHGLPAADRQLRTVTRTGVVHRDAVYAAQHTIVELDGRVGHDLALDRWADLARDIDAATGGEATVRIGWGQVVTPCRLATGIGELLRARGWMGAPTPCGADCQLDVRADSVVPPAPGAGEATPSAAW